MMIALIACVVIAVVAHRFREFFKTGYRYAGRKAAPIRTWVLPVPQLYREILSRNFDYYRRLRAVDKPKFERKVCSFLYSKQFIPRQMDTVPIEARVLIAASAVQLTFGLPNVYLQHFDKILAYPNEYYSSITRQYHKGEVNPRFGIIVLSWRNFVEGYARPDHPLNVGLHEMAHALRLENIIRHSDFKFFDEALIEKFDRYARAVCEKPEERVPFFRPYACTNEHEFFSVAVENFFARPEAFSRELPELYDIMRRLLQQDPLKLMAPAEVPEKI